MGPNPAGTETCARLMVGNPAFPVFVKGSWFPNRFSLLITDGLSSWKCTATEEAVEDRATGWDESVAEYVQRAQLYLSHQHPDSTYSFIPDGENRKLSWTMVKNGTKLEGKWRCEKALNDKEVTCDILNFLMDSNIKLSDEVLRKKQSFEKMKTEAEKCLKQSEQFKTYKQQFEADVFKKFVAVLNSKKAKLRELRDRIAKLEPATVDRQDKENELDDETDDEDESEDEDSKKVEKQAEIHNPRNEVTSSVNETLVPTDAVSSSHLHQNEPSVPDKTNHSLQKHYPIKTEEEPKNDPMSSVVESAAALLADTTYTSAPKRRRKL